ncbi:MAG: bifunctional methionine sulfoxide reductase B/A protein [Candidatus Aminicenantes bacterium]|nr:bifunctional methionine sulfoxide reductase B/A protein [Candidatus Aminicenantes bacterium]
MKRTIILVITIFGVLIAYLSLKPAFKQESKYEKFARGDKTMIKKVEKTDKEWKKTLTPEQYRIMRKRGTEIAFSGKYNDHYEKGIYECAGCGTPLFSSETKYDHGTGWPSFTAPVDGDYIDSYDDFSHFMHRTEVRCAVCGAHLGHVFDDGPEPNYKHYCINSASLDFKPAEAQDKAATGSSTKSDDQARKAVKSETALFAAGCFWGIEHKFRQIPGVLDTAVGYTGGHDKNPTYKQVCTDKTGHAEAVKITFDSSQISYKSLLEYFFGFHDPTQLNQQGPDIGSQYRSAVFYLSKEQKESAEKMVKRLKESGRYSRAIVTEIVPASEFYRAEEYHQQYYEKRTRGKKAKGSADSCDLK